MIIDATSDTLVTLAQWEKLLKERHRKELLDEQKLQKSTQLPPDVELKEVASRLGFTSQGLMAHGKLSDGTKVSKQVDSAELLYLLQGSEWYLESASSLSKPIPGMKHVDENAFGQRLLEIGAMKGSGEALDERNAKSLAKIKYWGLKGEKTQQVQYFLKSYHE